jgi:hypothetical protein
VVGGAPTVAVAGGAAGAPQAPSSRVKLASSAAKRKGVLAMVVPTSAQRGRIQFRIGARDGLRAAQL